MFRIGIFQLVQEKVSVCVLFRIVLQFVNVYSNLRKRELFLVLFQSLKKKRKRGLESLRNFFRFIQLVSSGDKIRIQFVWFLYQIQLFFRVIVVVNRDFFCQSGKLVFFLGKIRIIFRFLLYIFLLIDMLFGYVVKLF